MAILSASVSRLVFIHKVHINGIVGNLLIKLGMQMAKRLSVFLQSQNPGFCRRKCVHPGNHTCTVFICIGFIKGFANQLIGDQSGFPHQFKRKYAGFIQLFHNDPGMFCNLSKTLIPIQILRSCTKPEFIISPCLHFTFPPRYQGCLKAAHFFFSRRLLRSDHLSFLFFLFCRSQYRLDHNKEAQKRGKHDSYPPAGKCSLRCNKT